MNQRLLAGETKNYILAFCSLQCRRILGAGVRIFVLGRHLGFSNSGGLGRGDIRRGSRGEVEKMGKGERVGLVKLKRSVQ